MDIFKVIIVASFIISSITLMLHNKHVTHIQCETHDSISNTIQIDTININ